jgi:hypothetical protein
MASRHDRLTVASLAVIASVVTVMLHEGVGHGVTSWLRGDVPTMLTSNHLSDLHSDRVVAAGGTIVNLIVGVLAYLVHRRTRGDTARYGWWLFAMFNLMEGTGYFLFSGLFGFGDWEAVITGIPGYPFVRIAMALFGIVSYTFVMGVMARAQRDFVRDRFALWTLPYLASSVVQCAAGVLDPEGLQLFLTSTVPATFGGASGLIWGNKFMQGYPEPGERVVARVPALWVIAVIVAAVHVGIDGPGIRLLPGVGG